eukprot:TRINITY_DN88203_c0_g1_i1.p1 TRINITY_DN88203_c0_g1~~TRINITY_DN88203_c0_g1_i1.p1  ORF type:complete len:863 (-),score=146.65 TRINITY_DN88203_c0_g1_i1:119-2707(-)
MASSGSALHRGLSSTDLAREQKRPRTGRDEPSAEDTCSDTASCSCMSWSCDSLQEDSPLSSPLGLRPASEPDLQLEEGDLEASIAQWKGDLAEVTAQPPEVLEELLLAHVREHGWDTAEYLSQVLLECAEGNSGRGAKHVMTAARLPLAPACAVDDTVCVICREEASLDMPMVEVSPLCGHRLHMGCLAAGVQLQRSGQAASLRCPACAEKASAPLSEHILNLLQTPGSPWSHGDLQARAKSRWMQAGQGALFRQSPCGSCMTRPSTDNRSMQVACHCASSHRFCFHCGQLPHEPVPCHIMMEVESFLENARGELRRLEFRPLINAVEGSSQDRDLITKDLRESQPHAEGLGETKHSFALDDDSGSCTDSLLREEFEHLLGGRMPGCLRRSAENALVLVRGWQLEQEDHGAPYHSEEQAKAKDETKVPSAADPETSTSEHLLESMTRPCPRCFVPIEKLGGCQHMTCTNASCRHEFCWLCLRDWDNPDHDGLTCALERLSRMSRRGVPADTGSSEEVMEAVEARIRHNFEAQTVETRPAREEDYAQEVRRRFGVALASELTSDREMLSAAITDGEEPLLLSLWLLRFYDRREREAREAAAVVFRQDGGTSTESAKQNLRYILAWIRSRWWLRLLPEDTKTPESDIELDVPAGGELEIRARLRAARLRAEHAVRCLELREIRLARSQLHADIVDRFMVRFCRCTDRRDISMTQLREMLANLLEEPHHVNPAQTESTSSRIGPCAAAIACAERASRLAKAASRSWQVGQLLEAVGHLRPMPGLEAERASLSCSKWVEEVEEKYTSLHNLLKHANESPSLREDSEWQLKVTHASTLLDDSRRLAFKFALDYCGGTRRNVQRRCTS